MIASRTAVFSKRKLLSTKLRSDSMPSPKTEFDISFPPVEERLKDVDIGVLFNGCYELRRVVITNDFVCFAEVNQETIIDFIPCADIMSVDDLDGITLDTASADESQNLASIVSLESVASTLSAFQIRTHRNVIIVVESTACKLNQICSVQSLSSS